MDDSEAAIWDHEKGEWAPIPPGGHTALTPAERAMTAAANQTPEIWEAELRAAGWSKRMAHVWASPAGALFLGPYGAWKAMKTAQRSETAREGCRKQERALVAKALENTCR
jgi:hypothetical protein